ncbi:MAG TPA: alpha/beta fold hydrolase [Solirubrobacteraceae bacterium]|nr:alpha/beta fold hydrolase [Solirubrobacteraceae bacterium]
MGRRSYSRRYGSHPEQVADLVLPEGPGPFPVVVLVHGGFWRARYGRNLMAALADDLAARGRAAWNVEYRRLDAGGGAREAAADVLAAVDALRDLDAPLALDEGVAVVGHSAGGQLALLAAAEGRAARAVGQAAVTDLEEGIRLRLGDGVVERFAAGADLAAASPIRRAPLAVPVLLVHGADDDTVPASMSEAFAARGGDVTLSVRPGEGHFEHIDPASGAWEGVAAWLGAGRREVVEWPAS